MYSGSALRSCFLFGSLSITACNFNLAHEITLCNAHSDGMSTGHLSSTERKLPLRDRRNKLAQYAHSIKIGNDKLHTTGVKIVFAPRALRTSIL